MRAAIIGAGVLGASAAFHLARAGAKVVVADQVHPGRATSAGAGIVCPWPSETRGDDWYRIASKAAAYYRTLLEHLPAPEIGYRQVGALCVARDAAELDAIEQLVRARAADAPDAGALARLDPAEARALFPPLDPSLSALRIGGGARVDGRLLSEALARGAQRHGARFVTGPAGLLAGDGRIAGIRVGTEEIAADRILICAGAWAPALLAPLGIRLDIAPQRGQISHLRVQNADTRHWPVILPPGSHYLLSFDDSRVVVGATRETGAGFDYRITAAGQAEVLAEALRIAPGLGHATLIETRVGFRPVGPDVCPMLGVVPGFDGRLIVGNGLGPSGLTIGPFAGHLLAQLALERTPDLDLAAYEPFRGSA